MVNPSTVVLKNYRDSETVSVTVRGVDIKAAKVFFVPKGHPWDEGHDGPWGSKSKDEVLKSYGKHEPVWFSDRFTKTIGWKDAVGAWSVRVVAWGVNGKTVYGDASFFVKHVRWNPPKGPKATRIVGFDASPEPVKAGRKLALEGRLQVARCYGDWYYEWDDYVSVHGGGDSCYDGRKYWHDWYRLGWEEIDVYFLPKGSKKWKYITSTDTNPNGTFYTEVKAFKSGTWGVRYEGNRHLGSSEAYDYVKVVKK
ncbi:hypothetical protein [Acrocarpospora catenulata]|uniref:hypothetical protein n=1 Tax=Acrocarpospora catenulata TaxID=2836182 RepID=UPI001BDA0095|nr:hypothetical protein [Acrocarpospora catenulata]